MKFYLLNQSIYDKILIDEKIMSINSIRKIF